MNSLISYPTLIITPNKIKVKLYYYMLIHKVIKRKNKFKKILRNHFKIKGAKGIGMVYKKQDLKNYLSYNFYKINKIRDNNQLKSLINTKEITLKEDQYKINTLKNRLGGPEEILRNYKINLILDNRFKKYNPEFNLINNIKINNTIDVKSNSEENIKFKIDSKIKNLPVNNSIFNEKFKSNNKIKFQIENIENQDILKKENRKPSVRKFNEDKINKQDNIMNLNLNNKLYSTNNLNSGKKVDRNSGIITSNIKNKRENKVQEIGNKKFISTSNKSNNYQNNYYSVDKFISDNKIIKKNNFKSNLKDKFLVDFKNKNKMPHNLFILGENFRSNFFSRKQELNTVKENNNFNITLKSKLRFRRIIEIIKNKEISKYSSNYNDIKNKRNKAIKFYNINNKLIKDKKMEDFKILKLLITLRNKIKQIKLNKINTNKIKLNFTYKYKFDRI
jgi:hypothetical protein